MAKAKHLAELERVRVTITSQGKGFGPEELWEYVKANRTNISQSLVSRFEWDRNKAWEKHNIELARKLISEQKLVVHVPPVNISDRSSREIRQRIGNTRLYVSLPSKRGNEGSYERVDEVLRNATKRRELLQSALADLSAFERKHMVLNELSSSATHIRFLRNEITEAIRIAEEIENSISNQAV